MLAERDKLNPDIQCILDKQTEAWGIEVANMEIKHVNLNESMIRAIARQTEAERTRRAKVIAADGAFQAAEKLMQAARVLAQQPQGMTLRYLRSMLDISSEQSTLVVFPIPVKMLGALTGGVRAGRKTSAATDAPARTDIRA